MSTGLKTVSISKGALEYLHSIFDTENSKDRVTMKKINAAFASINEAYASYQAQRRSIRDKYITEVQQTDPNGNNVSKMIIPAKDFDKNKDEQEASAKEMIDLSFDRETLSFVRVCIDGVYKRPDAAQNGLSGHDQLQLFEECARAVYKALGMDYDESVAQEEIDKEREEEEKKTEEDDKDALQA